MVLKTAITFVVAEGLGQLKWIWYRSEHSLQDLSAYDDATRGPLGSLKLLWRLKHRGLLASCGALITVTMLAVDPFAQQMLAYYDCSTTVGNQQATLPRTNYFTPPGQHTGALEESIIPPIQSAINAGIFSSGVTLNFDCPTGNCTFPDAYATLGYCSHCRDVSDTLTIKKVCYNSANPSKPLKCQSGLGSNITSALPSGLSVTVVEGPSSPNVSIVACSEGTVEFIVAELGPYAFANTIKPACNTAQEKASWQCKGYGAAACTLTPCVKTYTGTQVRVGRLSEIEGESSALSHFGQSVSDPYYSLGLLDKECLSPHERSSLTSAGYDLTKPSRWLPYNATFNPTSSLAPDAPFPQSLFAHKCLYLVDEIFDDSLSESYLSIFFSGTLQAEYAQEPGTFVGYNGPQNLQTIYNYGDVDFDRIDSIFHNISESLTMYIRQNGQANHSEQAIGQVEHYATCLKVEWGWIALPAALAVMTLILLMAIASISHTTGVEVWKSSPLILIFHNFISGPRVEALRQEEETHNINKLHGMKKVAETIQVRLVRGSHGSGLVDIGQTEMK